MTYKKLSALSGLLLVMAFTNGCALMVSDRIHYTWDDTSKTPPRTTTKTTNGNDIIGIGLSGGGSRASVYGAAALEVLAEAGILDKATYISSVSGGGFPAAYYALKKPTPCTTEKTGPECESYAAFKQAMRHNFLGHMTRRQLAKPGRITSPTRRLSSLQEALDKKIIDEATFGELPASPILLINGARYDDGRRFVFSTAAIPEEDSDIAQFTNETLRSASFSLPGCTRPTPNDFPVALAIAISAGFPPLLGPASIEMPTDCEGNGSQFWHLGDGGILDNTGVETIEDFALRTNQKGATPERIIIFSLDAGRSTPAETMMQARNLKLWTSDPGRVVEIVGMRAKAYREVALDRAENETGSSIVTINMRYTDARITAWPASCGDQEGGAEAIAAHLQTIPTNLKISDCNADLMELAARDVVTRALQENAALLDSLKP